MAIAPKPISDSLNRTNTFVVIRLPLATASSITRSLTTSLIRDDWFLNLQTARNYAPSEPPPLGQTARGKSFVPGHSLGRNGLELENTTLEICYARPAGIPATHSIAPFPCKSNSSKPVVLPDPN